MNKNFWYLATQFQYSRELTEWRMRVKQWIFGRGPLLNNNMCCIYASIDLPFPFNEGGRNGWVLHIFKDFSNNKIGNVEWNFAWFIKCWLPLRLCSTGSWPPWLRQILPHFISLYRQFLVFRTLRSQRTWIIILLLTRKKMSTN